MKVRVVKRDNKFYPQYYRFLCGWQDYTETDICIDGLVVTETKSFDKVTDTVMFLKSKRKDPEEVLWSGEV